MCPLAARRVPAHRNVLQSPTASPVAQLQNTRTINALTIAAKKNWPAIVRKSRVITQQKLPKTETQGTPSRQHACHLESEKKPTALRPLDHPLRHKRFPRGKQFLW